jgi:AhpC/TSA antioxidant enzyme
LGEAHEEILGLGGSVVAAFQYRADPTFHFCRRRGAPFDCLGDPKREAYRAVGLESGGPLEYLGPRAALGWVKAAAHGNFGGRPKGDVSQRPGTFVIAPDGSVVLAHYNRNSADNPTNEQVLEAVRAAAPGATPG